MRKTKYSALLAGAFFLASPAQAQEPALPDFLKDFDGVAYQGEVSGMSLYSMEGFDGLWMVSPDGRTAMAGTIFSSAGRDVGAAFSGSEPVRSFEVDGQALLPEEPAPIEQASGQEITEFFSDADAVSAEPASVADMTAEARAALSDFSEEEQLLMMTTLTELLRDVKNEVEFQSVVKVWTEDVAGRYEAKKAGSLAPAADTTARVDVTPTFAPAPALQDAAPAELPVAERLLDDARNNAFWFAIGNPDAPTVYAFIDPACPYCAQAVVALGESIETGQLQLRVILAPVMSETSPGLISGILLSANPPQAFMDHEYRWNEGRRNSEMRPWEDLPGELRDGVLSNVEMMRGYEIPGVPFFIYDTPEGAKSLSGIPDSDTFFDATVDTFQGGGKRAD